MRQLILCSTIIAGWLFTANTCDAFKPAPPKRHYVLSPNSEYVLDVDPKTQVHTVYATKDRKTPLWSFSRHVWVKEPFFLSNDGKVVASLSWKFVQIYDLADSVCLQFINKDGVFKSYTFGEICSNPAFLGISEVGPVGWFWRRWYNDVQQDGDTIWVQTSGLYAYTFSMSDGAVISAQLVPGNLLRSLCFWVLLASILVALCFIARRLWRRKKVSPAISTIEINTSIRRLDE